MKFTDSTSIYKLKTPCEIKSLNFSVQEAKGYKTVRMITLYVNSIQDVDLAEMKTNWALWQKVCDLNVDVSAKSIFHMSLPLPVMATNVLIQYHSINLVKPVEVCGRNKGGPSKYFGGGPGENNRGRRADEANAEASGPVEGLDPVLQLLPKEVTSQLSVAMIKQ